MLRVCQKLAESQGPLRKAIEGSPGPNGGVDAAHGYDVRFCAAIANGVLTNAAAPCYAWARAINWASKRSSRSDCCLRIWLNHIARIPMKLNGNPASIKELLPPILMIWNTNPAIRREKLTAKDVIESTTNWRWLIMVTLSFLQQTLFSMRHFAVATSHTRSGLWCYKRLANLREVWVFAVVRRQRMGG